MPFSFASAKPRRVSAARFIGGRRYRQARKPCARFRKHQSSQFYLRIVRLGLQFLSGPISGFFAVMRRASSYGELATQCLTPASRGCNAGDGPAVAMEHDAWATYMKNKARPSTPKPKHTKPEKPQRARWVDLEIDLTYVEGGLLQLSPEDFKTNATGLVLLTRQMFIEASAVRSTAPLAVLLPGDRNSDLIAAGINDSAIHVKYAFLRDALLGKYFRKKVTMVQLGTNPVGFADPSGDKDWSNEAYCDFSVFISKQVFEDDNWSAYIAASRKEIPAKIRNLHTGLTAETCPFFAWRKLDDGTHRATFRAPTKHEKLFLQASGILGPFFIQKMCRTQEEKAARAQEIVVLWLAKKTYSDALALIRSFESHLGLVFANGNLGVRVAAKDVAAARKLFAATDPRFADSNRSIVGKLRFEALGLPRGCTRQDIITNFVAWKGGWHVLPQRQIFTADGESIWYLLADVSPPERFYEGSNCRVLIQDVTHHANSVNRQIRQTVQKQAAAPGPAPRSSKPSSGNQPEFSTIAAAYEKRFTELEARMTSYEGRLTDTEQRLTNRIDNGFSQVMSQLQNMQAPALPAASTKRTDPPQGTPHKGGPRKDQKTNC